MKLIAPDQRRSGQGRSRLAVWPVWIFIACHVSFAWGEPGADPLNAEEVRTLFAALEVGTAADRERSAHKIWSIVAYEEIDGIRTEQLIELLHHAQQNPLNIVRTYTMEAAGRLKHQAAIPLLILGLKDRWEPIRNAACNGLRDLGKKADTAVPALLEGIQSGQLSGRAFYPLAAVQGSQATAVVLAAGQKGDAEMRFHAASVLQEIGDHSAMQFMSEALHSESHPNAPLLSAMYFSRFNDAVALREMRYCLNLLGVDDHGHHKWVADAHHIRAVAARNLGHRKDAQSYEPICRMARRDSIIARAAAVEALGLYGNEGAIPILVERFQDNESGFGSRGHIDGTLRKAVVESLARIDTERSLQAIYDGLSDERARRFCLEFWMKTTEPRHFDALLRFFNQDPEKHAAPALSRQLHQQGWQELDADQAQAAEASFLRTVQDPNRFGANLTDKRTKPLRITYRFSKHGFAYLTFTTGHGTDRRALGGGWSVLYRQVDGRWEPIAEISRWFE